MLVSGVLAHKGGTVVTVAPGATVSDAVGRLRQHRIGVLVVSEDGRQALASSPNATWWPASPTRGRPCSIVRSARS